MSGGEYRFSNDWFLANTYGKRKHRRESYRELFERVLLPRAGSIKAALELGVSEGRSALWLMHNLPLEHWCGVDPWRPGREHHAESFRIAEANFWHNMKVAATRDLDLMHNVRTGCTMFSVGKLACRVAKRSSHDYLRHDVDEDYPGEFFDAISIDGDHSGPGALLDMVLAFRKLKVGGIMLVDDMMRRWHQARPHVYEAAQAFWMTHEHLCHRLVLTPFHMVIEKHHSR